MQKAPQSYFSAAPDTEKPTLTASMLWVRDDSGRLIPSGDDYTKVFGAVLCAASLIERVHPQDRPALLRLQENLGKSSNLLEAEYRLQDAAGEYRWVMERMLPRVADAGYASQFTSIAFDVTARKNAEALLQEGEQRFRDVADMACDWIWEMDSDLRFSYVSQRFFDSFDMTPDDVMGKTRTEFAGASLDDERWRQHLDDLHNHRSIDKFEYQHKLPNGRIAYIEINGRPIHDANGLFKGYRGTGTDRTAVVEARRGLEEAKVKADLLLEELRRRDQELRQQNERFRVALENMSQGLCMFDTDKKLIVCNEQYASMYGLSRDLLKPGTPFRDIVKYRIGQGLFAMGDPESYVRERLAAVEEDKASVKIQELTDGRTLAISHRPMPDGGWLATHDDITEIRRIEARLAHMAHHDALTDLPNRLMLRDAIVEAMKRAKRGHGFALLCLDLDGFKAVNDTLGHPVGDELLKIVARRLLECVRETDMVARLGGDEFAILQGAIEDPKDTSALAVRICEALGKTYDLLEHQVVSGTSIGIAIAPSDGEDPDLLMKNADIALYRAKSEGRGCFRFFKPGMDEIMRTRRDMERDLRLALAKGQLELYYQPLVRIRDNDIVGFEALLRWNHPQHGLLSPSEFIPLAEETGLIIDIGDWVLRHACAEAVTWPGNLKVAINLSPVQFKKARLLSSVSAALRESGLPASRLELEITETALLTNKQTVAADLYALRHLGVRLALDDFGTGYSSLNYLRSFTFDRLKIDRTFIGHLSQEQATLDIVRAVSGLAAKLGIETTAEGVETEAQMDQIRNEGCTEMQGFLFSPPVPASGIKGLLEKRRKDTRAA